MPNSFYTLDHYSLQDDHILAAIRFDPEHPIFSGHFPGRPVVPGVCMVQIIKHLVIRALGREDIILSEGHQLKFLQLIIPDRKDLVQVAVTVGREDGRFTAQGAFKKEDVVLFKMTGAFTLLK